MWHEPFVVKVGGEEIALLLMDTQVDSLLSPPRHWTGGDGGAGGV